MDVRIRDLPPYSAAHRHMPPGVIASQHQNNCGNAVRRLHAFRAQRALADFVAMAGNSQVIAWRPGIEGLYVRFLQGGIDAWPAMGRPRVDKPVGPSP